MIPLPFELAVIIDGSAAVAAVAMRAALRERRSASLRPQLPGRSREAAPLSAKAVPAGEAAGLAALISGVMTASGITTGLWMSGQARTACQSLVLAAAAVLIAGAGYAAGLRDRRVPPRFALPEQETADLGAQLLAQMYGQPPAPEPRRPRPGGQDGRSWPPPG